MDPTFGYSYTESLGAPIELTQTITATSSGRTSRFRAHAYKASGYSLWPNEDPAAFDCAWSIARKGVDLSNLDFFDWSGTCPVMVVGGDYVKNLRGTRLNGQGFAGYAFSSEGGFYPNITVAIYTLGLPLGVSAPTTTSFTEPPRSDQLIGYVKTGAPYLKSMTRTISIAGLTEIGLDVWYMPEVTAPPDGTFFLSDQGFTFGPAGDIFSPSGGTYLGSFSSGSFSVPSWVSTTNGMIYLCPSDHSRPGWLPDSDWNDFYAKQNTGISITTVSEWGQTAYPVYVVQPEYIAPVDAGVIVSVESRAISWYDASLYARSAEGEVLYSTALASIFGLSIQNQYGYVYNPNVSISRVHGIDGAYIVCYNGYAAIVEPGATSFNVLAKRYLGLNELMASFKGGYIYLAEKGGYRIYPCSTGLIVQAVQYTNPNMRIRDLSDYAWGAAYSGTGGIRRAELKPTGSTADVLVNNSHTISSGGDSTTFFGNYALDSQYVGGGGGISRLYRLINTEVGFDVTLVDTYPFEAQMNGANSIVGYPRAYNDIPTTLDGGGSYVYEPCRDIYNVMTFKLDESGNSYANRLIGRFETTFSYPQVKRTPFVGENGVAGLGSFNDSNTSFIGASGSSGNAQSSPRALFTLNFGSFNIPGSVLTYLSKNDKTIFEAK